MERALSVYFDLLDLQVACKRLRELEKGTARLVDAEDAWKDLGIWVDRQNSKRKWGKMCYDMDAKIN